MPEALQMFLVQFQELSRGIRIQDLLDVAIIALIIYKMLWTIRKTSSGRVLKGVLMGKVQDGSTTGPYKATSGQGPLSPRLRQSEG